MGYTHYWRQHRDFTEAEWVTLTEYARRVVLAALCEGIELANGMTDPNTDPDIDRVRISLNGEPPNDCDTFHLPRRCPDHAIDSCKTQQLPYDPVVVTILHAACTIAPDAIQESSDGDETDGALMFHFTDRLSPPTGPKE